MNEEEKTKIKFSEKFSLKFRKTIIASRLFTILTVLMLIAAFIGLNMGIQALNLPQIDVTANQLYTLSESSKKALEMIDQDIKIYVFGIEEDDSVVGLIKQYTQANDKITYEMLSSETNLAKVQEFELEDGYAIVVIESGESKKIIDASSEFHSYDYSTYAEVDTTEQTLTNSILSLSTVNKPKVYFVEGHNEFKIASDETAKAELGVLSTYLKNEAFEIASVNLTSTGSVPDDCDVLAIMSPENDFLENETQAILDYINRGGNIFLTRDILNQTSQLVNFQKILDVYGVTIENGYILEADSNYTVSNYPYVFRPQVSNSNDITADIASDSYMWLAYSQKLNFLPEEELNNLKVTYEELLGTTDSAVFITDFSSDINAAAASSQKGHFTIAAQVTKTISEATENEGESTEEIQSKLIISGNGQFMTDYIVSELSSQYPLSYLGSNKDFAINSISVLAEKEGGLTLRKDMAGTSYRFTATKEQNRIVLAVIFAVPVVILLIGIVVWRQRKKRK